MWQKLTANGMKIHKCCRQLLSPKCLRKLYHRLCSVVNCNYPGSIHERTETRETKMLLKPAARASLLCLFQTCFFSTWAVLPLKCPALPISVRVISKLLVNRLKSYLAHIMCCGCSLFLNQKGSASNTNLSLLIQASNGSPCGQECVEDRVIL